MFPTYRTTVRGKPNEIRPGFFGAVDCDLETTGKLSGWDQDCLPTHDLEELLAPGVAEPNLTRSGA